MSNLVEHARTELKLIDEDPIVIEQYLKVIQAFADMGHSGSSAAWALQIIPKLLSFEHLSPITSNPAEWMMVTTVINNGEDLWQSKRNPALFSHDGGITYYNVNSRNDINRSEPAKLDL